jgi:diaminopimelate epimerase
MNIPNVSDFMKKEAVISLNKDRSEDGFCGNAERLVERTPV